MDTKQNLPQITKAFALDFIKKNNIPVETPLESVSYGHKGQGVIRIQPKQSFGNMSAIIEELAIRIEVFESESTRPHLHFARIHFDYAHTQNGNNGYTLRKTVITKLVDHFPDTDQTVEYAGFIDDDIANAYLKALNI